MKIRPVGAEFIHADLLTDGRTGSQVMTKLLVAFRSFENAPKKVSNVCEWTWS